MSYLRVIPRDLFNEAKLLKCLGRLALILHDGVGVPRGLTIQHDDTETKGFQIEQDESTGALYCANLECTFRHRLIGLHAPYNSKDAYPLKFILGDEEGDVFTVGGTLSSEFLKLLNSFESLNP